MKRLRRDNLIDVFTDTPLGGNPLAVFTMAKGPSFKTMQDIARELDDFVMRQPTLASLYAAAARGVDLFAFLPCVSSQNPAAPPWSRRLCASHACRRRTPSHVCGVAVMQALLATLDPAMPSQRLTLRTVRQLGSGRVRRLTIVTKEQITTRGQPVRDGVLPIEGEVALVDGKPVYVKFTTQ